MKIHMVKEGDTLYEISKKYDVPLQTLIDANPQIANPDVLAVGDKVKIPSSAVPVGNDDENVIHKHVVKQGDSLWKLSKAWGVSLQAMIDANPQLKNPNALLVGEFVNIPAGGQTNEQAPGSEMGTGTGGTGGMGKKNTAPKAPTAPIAETPPPVEPVPEQPAVPIPVMPAPEQPKNEFHYEFEYSEVIVNQPKQVEYVNIVPEHTPAPHVKENPCGCGDHHHAPQVASYYDFPNVPMSNESPAFVSPTNLAPNMGPVNYAPSNVSPTHYAPNLAPTNFAPINYAPVNMAPNAAPNLSPISYTPNVSPVGYTPYSPMPNNAQPYLSPSQYSPMQTEANNVPQLNAYSGGYPGISDAPYAEGVPNVVSPEMYAPNANEFAPQPCGCEGGAPVEYPYSAYMPQENVGGWNSPYMNYPNPVSGMYQAPAWNMPQTQPSLGYPLGFHAPGVMPGVYPSYGTPYSYLVPGAPIGGAGMREGTEDESTETGGEGSNEQNLTVQTQGDIQEEEKVKVSTHPAEKRSSKKQSRSQEKNTKSRNTSNKAKTRRNPWIGN